MLPVVIAAGSYLAKGWERLLSILVWILIIGGLVWCVYVTVVKPHTKPTPTQTVQSGGVANTWNVKIGFGGCARLTPEIKK